MPSRIVLERILESESMAGLSDAAERLWLRCLVIADDYGILRGEPALVRARCFGLLLDTWTEARVAGAIDENITAGHLDRAVVGGRVYLRYRVAGSVFRRRVSHARYPEALVAFDNYPTSHDTICGLQTASADSRCHLQIADGVTPNGQDVIMPIGETSSCLTGTGTGTGTVGSTFGLTPSSDEGDLDLSSSSLPSSALGTEPCAAQIAHAHAIPVPPAPVQQPLLQLVAQSADAPRRPTVPEQVQAVYEHYRKHHPRCAARLVDASPESKRIRDRLREGYSVEQLCAAIDAVHADGWHQGQNNTGRKYLSLELIVRSATHVQRYLELGAGDGKADWTMEVPF
jgi:hypothetical protein